jgi:hypothetical protein
MLLCTNGYFGTITDKKTDLFMAHWRFELRHTDDIANYVCQDMNLYVF